jgi:hypothetical protein
MVETYLSLLIFVAPVAQILLSVRRIANKTKLPLIAIAAIALLLGTLLSVLAGYVFFEIGATLLSL